MLKGLTLKKKALVLLAVTLLLELGLVAVQVSMLRAADAELGAEKNARAVLSHLDRIAALRQSVTIGLTKLIHEPTSTRYQSEYDAYMREIPQEFAKLKEEVGNVPVMADVEALERTCNQCIRVLAKRREAFLAGLFNEHIMAIYELQFLSDQSIKQSDKIYQTYKNIVDEQTRAREAQRELANRILLAGIILNSVLVSLIGVLLVNAMSRLEVIRDNSRRLAASQPLRPKVGGTDEITALDKVFHNMADALQEAARKELAVIENAVDVICSINSEMKFTSVSKASITAWRFPPDDLIGQRIISIVHEEDREKTIQAFEKALSNEPVVNFENRLVRKDGQIIDLLWSAYFARNEKSLFCVAHDITERKRAADEVERLKREFVSMISHDLKSPLASIKTTVEVVSQGVYGDLNETGNKRLEEANASIGRLMSLIRGLIEMEKLDTGKLTVDLDDIDLQPIIDRSISEVRGYAQQQGVSIEISVDKIFIRGDSERLVQVAVNLLSNAIKFSPSGSKVLVTTHTLPGFVRIDFKDHGRGIPAEFKDSLFQRFQQSSQDDAKKLGGSGLGLSICKAIIESHNGEIGYTCNQDGPGSTFWIKLPVAIPASVTGSAIT